MGQVDDTNDSEFGNGDRPIGSAQNDARSGTPSITAHQSDGSHTVFTESGDSDAWIATDVVVPARR
jgi:hypothetical protein